MSAISTPMNGIVFSAPRPAAIGVSRPILVTRPADRLAQLLADPRQAIQEDSIYCLICGRTFRQLTNTHLRMHDISAREYKRRFGYNRGRSLMCRALRRLYTERAKASGLAARIRRRPILAEPELRRLGGSRTIALEELLTRRDARRRAAAPSRAAIATQRST
ncbi:MAG TPA: MucR family transcriptional regulator [Methylomirabilota bacterium]|jgi:predicted transcriptional regulator|nr:MucR family transcriptional regulator [Methylomirabilota bacterium]